MAGKKYAKVPVNVIDWLPEPIKGHDYVPAANRRSMPLPSMLRDKPFDGLSLLFPVVYQERDHFRQPEVAARFARLKMTWREETAFAASLRERVMHRSYQQIIGMGPEVLPQILESLKAEPDHWYWALSAITGKDPAEGSETFAAAREAWLLWGQGEGLIE
jgi:hypothetical protein